MKCEPREAWICPRPPHSARAAGRTERSWLCPLLWTVSISSWMTAPRCLPSDSAARELEQGPGTDCPGLNTSSAIREVCLRAQCLLFLICKVGLSWHLMQNYWEERLSRCYNKVLRFCPWQVLRSLSVFNKYMYLYIGTVNTWKQLTPCHCFCLTRGKTGPELLSHVPWNTQPLHTGPFPVGWGVAG